MFWLSKRRADRSGAGRAIFIATLLTLAAGSAAPASAFVADSAREDSVRSRHAIHAHHRHAPSGANVIGRGIGGLHGDLAREAAAREAIVR